MTTSAAVRSYTTPGGTTPLSLEKPAQGGKDDTMSGLAASLHKLAEKASTRTTKTKAVPSTKEAARSARTMERND